MEVHGAVVRELVGLQEPWRRCVRDVTGLQHRDVGDDPEHAGEVAVERIRVAHQQQAVRHVAVRRHDVVDVRRQNVRHRLWKSPGLLCHAVGGAAVDQAKPHIRSLSPDACAVADAGAAVRGAAVSRGTPRLGARGRAAVRDALAEASATAADILAGRSRAARRAAVRVSADSCAFAAAVRAGLALRARAAVRSGATVTTRVRARRLDAGVHRAAADGSVFAAVAAGVGSAELALVTRRVARRVPCAFVVAGVDDVAARSALAIHLPVAGVGAADERENERCNGSDELDGPHDDAPGSPGFEIRMVTW